MSDRNVSGPGVGLGRPFRELAPVKQTKYGYDEGESKQLADAFNDPERAPDELDALLGGGLSRAVNIVTPRRELERQERIRREGEIFAQAQQQAPEEEDELYPGGIDSRPV